MLTDKQLEGQDSVRVRNKRKAVILRVLQGDRMGVNARVRYLDKGDIGTEWVFAKDQPGDINHA